MTFSRSRSLLYQLGPLFRLAEHTAAANSRRVTARFIPAAACSTAHVGRSNTWTHDAFTPWSGKSRWGWGWDPAYWNTKAQSAHPAIDVVEKADAYVIEADLPGVKKGELDVRVGDDGWSLVVEGKRIFKVDGKEDGEKADVVSERAESFMRKVWFRQAVDGRGVKAKLEDGVLRLHVPKKVSGDGSVRVDVA